MSYCQAPDNSPHKQRIPRPSVPKKTPSRQTHPPLSSHHNRTSLPPILRSSSNLRPPIQTYVPPSYHADPLTPARGKPARSSRATISITNGRGPTQSDLHTATASDFFLQNQQYIHHIHWFKKGCHYSLQFTRKNGSCEPAYCCGIDKYNMEQFCYFFSNTDPDAVQCYSS